MSTPPKVLLAHPSFSPLTFPGLFTAFDQHDVLAVPLPGIQYFDRPGHAFLDNSLLADRISQVGGLSDAQMLRFSILVDGKLTRVFPLARAEILATLASHKQGLNYDSLPAEEAELIQYLLTNFRVVVDRAFAAAAVFAEMYAKLPAAPLALMGPGAFLGERILLEILKVRNTKVLMLEPLGDKFWFIEERYTPLAQGSDFRYPNVRDQLSEATEQQATAALFELQGAFGGLTYPLYPERNRRQAPRVALLVENPEQLALSDQSWQEPNPLAAYVGAAQTLLNNSAAMVSIILPPPLPETPEDQESKLVIELRRWASTLDREQQGRIRFVPDAQFLGTLQGAPHLLTFRDPRALVAAASTGLELFTLGWPWFVDAGARAYPDAAAFCKDLVVHRHMSEASPANHAQRLAFIAKLGAFHLAPAWDVSQIVSRMSLPPPPPQPQGFLRKMEWKAVHKWSPESRAHLYRHDREAFFTRSGKAWVRKWGQWVK
jgi:hypothetical protein